MAEVTEWKFDPKEILASTRKVKGIFHKAIVDKDNELITPDAIRKSIPDYMHLPALHDFHKERPVGLATKIWQEKDGSFGFEGVIKATEDCDDIWEKISKGNYDHVSIFGRRTEGNRNCSIPQEFRTGPCITNGVRLDSISVCDDNARNDNTSLAVKKAQLIWDGLDMIQKAETAGESNLMHTVTDYPEKKCAPKCTKKKYKVIEKGDEDDEMTEDVEKSKDVHYKGGIKDGLQVTHRSVRPRTAQKRGDSEYEIRQNRREAGLKKGEDEELPDEEAPEEVEKGDDESAPSYAPSDYSNKHANQLQRQASDDSKWVKEGLKKDVKKGDVSEDDADDDNQYDEETDSSKKKLSPKDKEGQWSKDKNPQGSVKVKKAEQEIDTETRGKDAKEEMDEDEDDEEVEKGIQKIPLKKLPAKKKVNSTKLREVKKGDTMEEKEEVSQEYVTKAMVPIEEVDTIIKARTEEISKAYTAQFDEIKKANLAAIDEVKKAYDTKIAELTTRVDKMSEETIRKGGSIVVIPQLLDPSGQGIMSNADALAKITAGK
jgi:hypothetical protein